MTVNVELELAAYLLSVDDCRHAVFSFIKQCQYSLVNIVVDKDNTFLCTLDQVGHESVGIINLPIEVKARIIRIFTSIAASERKTLLSIATPFSVNT